MAESRFFFLFIIFLSFSSFIFSVNAEENNTISAINSTIQINDSMINLTDPEDNSSLPENSTLPIVFCNTSLYVDSDRDFYIAGDKIKIYNRISDKSIPFIIDYWVEDLAGNIVKDHVFTSNANSKQFTPDIDESDKVFVIKNRLSYVGCITPFLNMTSEKVIFFLNNDSSSQDPNSSILIEKVYGKDLSFGDILRVSILAYRGDTRKYSVKAWVQGKYKVSEETTIHLNSKFTEYDTVVPIQLKSNCDNRYSSGTYTLVIKGLNLSVSQPIHIEGKSKLCKTITVEKFIEKEPPIERKPKFVFAINSSYILPDDMSFNLYVENNDGISHNISFESYLFRNNRKFSYVTDGLFSIGPASSKSVPISLRSNASSGEYKIMAKFRVDDQSTVRSFSKEVFLLPIKAESSASLLPPKQDCPVALNSSIEPNLFTADVVYESRSLKSESLAPAFLVLALVILSIFLIFLKS